MGLAPAPVILRANQHQAEHEFLCGGGDGQQSEPTPQYHCHYTMFHWRIPLVSETDEVIVT
jgi:hypothetical protein